MHSSPYFLNTQIYIFKAIKTKKYTGQKKRGPGSCKGETCFAPTIRGVMTTNAPHGIAMTFWACPLRRLHGRSTAAPLWNIEHRTLIEDLKIYFNLFFLFLNQRSLIGVLKLFLLLPFSRRSQEGFFLCRETACCAPAERTSLRAFPVVWAFIKDTCPFDE